MRFYILKFKLKFKFENELAEFILNFGNACCKINYVKLNSVSKWHKKTEIRGRVLVVFVN